MFSGGCPFTNFGPCKKSECRFFINYNRADFACAILATFVAASIGQSESFMSYNSLKTLGFMGGMPLSPEAANRCREDGILFLEEMRSLRDEPDLPQVLHARMKKAVDKLESFLGMWERDIPAEARKPCGRPKGKKDS